jgi:hypothetical protein
MKQIGTGWTMYNTDFGEMLPCHWPGYASSGGTSHPWRTYEAGRVQPGVSGWYGTGDDKQGPWNLGMLYDAKIVANPALFYCPSSANQQINIGQNFTYEYYSTAGQWPCTTAVSADDKIRTGYNYLPQAKTIEEIDAGHRGPKIGNGTCPGSGCKPLTQNDIDPNKSIFTDLIQNLEATAHKSGGLTQSAGLNAMFGDTHVNFQSSSANPDAFDPHLWKSSSDGDYIGNNEVNFRIVMNYWLP